MAAAGRPFRESAPGLAAIADLGPLAVDSAAPLLTPDDDQSEDDVRLILDPDPELSSGHDHARLEPRLSTDDIALMAPSLSGPRALHASFWLWAIVLAAVVTGIVAIVLR